MDYEKAYKEAIERAKNYEREYRSVLKRLMITIDRFREKKFICIDLNELESYFPELKRLRSDEIKEKIKDVIRLSSASDGERICMIDWVETHSQQGEQKTTSNIRYEVGAGDSLYVVNGKPFDYEHATITQKDFAPKVDMPRYSIGDVLCDKSCSTLDKNSQPNIEILDIMNGMYICNNCIFPISQQDEYELVAKRVAPKQEWSETDENRFQNIIACIEDCYNEKDAQDLIRWFKSLRHQPKQVWSEEDESYINNAIAACRNFYGEYSVTAYWLKSIKDRVKGKGD